MRHTLNHVELVVPDDWKDMSVVTLVAPAGERFRANAVVTTDALTAPDVRGHALAQLDRLKREVRGYTLHREAATTVGGKSAHSIEHSFRAEGGLVVRQLQIYVARGGRVITLTLTDADATFAASRAVFDGIVGSFRV